MSEEVLHKATRLAEAQNVLVRPVTSLRRNKGPMAPLNSVTRAETELSVSRNQELKNMMISSTLGRRCPKVLGMGSNHWPAQGGKEGHSYS